jgi:pyridoxamine 5'-phosphate oxidase
MQRHPDQAEMGRDETYALDICSTRYPAHPAPANDLLHAEDPWELFAVWMGEAALREPCDPNAMALATTGADGVPDVRTVLLKQFDESGFVFYTNSGSQKGRQLTQNPHAALMLHWKSLGRQIRARGLVAPVADAESDTYFESRARLSQIGAVASQQSQPLTDRATLVAKVTELLVLHGDQGVPRPEHWTGYRIAPATIEFWQDAAYRLHDRVRFTRHGATWHRALLYP